MIRALVSDFGGVLTSPLLHAFTALQEESSIPPEALGMALFRITEADGANPLFELECGRLTEADFLARLEDQLTTDLGRSVHFERFAERYFEALDPNEKLFAYYRTLHDRGLRLLLLTNNVREWEPLWRPMLPIDELFEGVVDSAFVGIRKPDPKIYELTESRLEGIAPEEIVFVDDLEINCDAAQERGWNAVVFRTTEQAMADLEGVLAESK